MGLNTPLSHPGEDTSRIGVERAMAELRAGRPVAVRSGDDVLVVLGVEALDAVRAAYLEALNGEAPRLILTAPRLRRLGVDRVVPGSIPLARLDLARIETLALHLDARLDAQVRDLTALENATLELLALSLLLPAAIGVKLRAVPDDMIVADLAAVLNFRAQSAALMRIIGRAPVPLEGAVDTEFVIFRGGEGLRDQAAVIVGKPDLNAPVTVRLHSACLTGDLFGSLKCDCGDQLRGTARFMAENGGGVILYLDHEGRGNGLGNKIRAYELQAKGFDTYEADAALGFGQDQRHFDFAAIMLKQLGITRVAVMTNNPVKIAALRDAGLEVVSDNRIQGRETTQNRPYLEAKRDKGGHMLAVKE